MRTLNLKTSSAAVALALVFSARGARGEDVVVSPQAKQHFLAGVALLQDPAKPRYEEAYREFQAAYQDSPSFKILANLALSAMMLERDQEAIAAYEKYLAAATSLDPLERAQVERDLLTLKVGIIELDVTTQPAGATIIDTRIPVQGESITNVYGPIEGSRKLVVRQGHHVLKARLPGRDESVWEFDAPGGSKKSHTFELKEPPPPVPYVPPPPLKIVTTRPVPKSVWIGAATTGGLALGMILTGAFAADAHARYADRNTGNDPSAASDLRSTGITLNAATDVFLGATILAAGVTTVLYLTRPSYSHKEVAFRPGFQF